MTQIIMVGSRGRMGQAIIRLANASPEFGVAAEVDAGDDLAGAVAKGDAVIDFSHHSATRNVIEAAIQQQKPLVIGTTGHTPEELAAIHAAATRIPLVFAPNFSIGVNVLFYLTRKAAEILGSGFDQEVIEMHHRLKLDAPSGTAKRLGEILCEVKGRPYDDLIRNGREGETGQRTVDEIGMHSLRGGDVVGDHTVVFATVGERVELTHKASSRDTFGSGALRAAAWVRGQPAGLYSMQDVLGLR
jgi:4-hydroxy-tetrahydrodipicolinate reductase